MNEGASQPGPPARRSHQRYPRGTEDFDRVVAFSDGVFAIAMTLLVITIELPAVRPEEDLAAMAGALEDRLPSVISFVISFAVIGRYWIAHYRFFSLLHSVDSGLIVLNLGYLAFVAFLPFPTDLLGAYFGNALAVATYAVTVAAVSGAEVVLLRWAYRNRLLRQDVSPEVYRWGFWMSLSPVAFFLASVPVAFVSSVLAVAMWFLPVPLQILASRWQPEGVDDLPG